MAAVVLRFSVGSAKAASTARPGRPSSSARSEPPMRHAAQPAPPPPSPAAPTRGGAAGGGASATASTAPAARPATGTSSHSRPICSSCARSKRTDDAPGPGAQPGGQQRGRQRAQADPRRKAPHLRVARARADHRAGQAHGQRHGGRAAAGQQHQRGHGGQRGRARRGRARRPAPTGTGSRRRAAPVSGVVSWPSCSRPRLAISASTARVGDGARVVDRVGLAAEGEGHRLRRLGARQLEGCCTR